MNIESATTKKFISTNMHHFLKYLYLGLVFLVLIMMMSPSVMGEQGSVAPCVLGEAFLRSQGDTPSISGGSGFIDENPPNISGSGVMDSGSLATMLLMLPSPVNPNELAQSQDAANSVLLLVIDDFDTLVGHLSHGDYVYGVATTAQSSLPQASFTIGTVNYAPNPTLESVVTNTQAQFAALNAETYDVIVLNMSWVLLGCTGTIMVNGNSINIDIPEFYSYLQENSASIHSQEETFHDFDLNQDHMVSFIEYLIKINEEVLTEDDSLSIQAALAAFIADTSNFEDNTFYEDFTNLLNGQLSSDDDNQGDDDEQGDDEFNGTVVPIAAAGNFSTAGSPRDPLVPAAFAEVIAVSGSLANDPATMWDSSHNGQLMAPAAWHYVSATHEYISGTSFSTPLVSVFVSFMAQNHVCDFGTMKGIAKDVSGNKEFLTEVIADC